MFTITRDINTMTKVASNNTYDMYICKCGKEWYTRALLKDTDQEISQAGFNTKKSAKECANHWAEWMR